MKQLAMLIGLLLLPCFAHQVSGANDAEAALQNAEVGSVQMVGTEKPDAEKLPKRIAVNLVFGIGKIIAIVSAVIILTLIVTVAFRWLWNMTMPDVFNLKAITFWQCFRLLLLVFILGAVFFRIPQMSRKTPVAMEEVLSR